MRLTFEALEVLDAIERKGSFAAAAAALHRVPSTITYTVQKLEEDLGYVIFRREGRRSLLTPAGRVLLEQGRELLEAAQRMLESAQQVNSGWESSITIALDTVWDLASFYPLVAEFHRLNTGVQVNLTEEVLGGSLEAMAEGRVDIVLGGPPPVINMPGVKFQQVLTSRWLFVVARDHPLCQQPQPLTEQDIKPYVSVVIADSSRGSAIASDRLFDKQLMMRVPGMSHKIEALIQGIGVGFLPAHKIQRQLDGGELVALAFDKEGLETPHYCAWRLSNKGRARRWFVDRLLAAHDEQGGIL